MNYYAKVVNNSESAVSSSLPYNDLGPGRWATRIEAGNTSQLYPISHRSACDLLATGVIPTQMSRADGSVFMVFEIHTAHKWRAKQKGGK